MTKLLRPAWMEAISPGSCSITRFANLPSPAMKLLDNQHTRTH